ncbi:MAG TPA: PQQ-binding-like beta-propeller repeat protein, partial [Candidatus Saccharimonadales bacterium]|nr:PQQ-binding-like beta-propeller repeat protein [Candidatus Saccharimonadales bacterium]
AIEAVILKALSKEHNDRYDSVADFIQALTNASAQSYPAKTRPTAIDTRGTGKHVVPSTSKKKEASTPDATPGNDIAPATNVAPPKRKPPQKPRPATQTKNATQFIPTWRSTTTGLDQVYYAEPTVAKGIIYAGTYSTGTRSSSSRHLRALDAYTGDHLWAHKTNLGIYNAPVVADGIVYFSAGHIDNGGQVWALDADTGEVIWSLETDEPLQASPIVVNDIVYVHSQHAVYAINAATGQQYWDVTLKAEIQGDPMITNNAVYIGTTRGHCYSVDADRGQKLATYTDVGQLHAAFKLDDNIVCLFAQDDQLYSLDMLTGDPYWSLRTEQHITNAIEIVDGVAYVSMQGTVENTSARTTLFAIDIVTGEQLWVTYLRNEIDTAPLVTDGIIYLITKNQDLYMLDTQQGKRIHSLRIGNGKISRPCVSNGWLYINNSEINAFKLS